MEAKTDFTIDSLVNEITNIGLEHHAGNIIQNAVWNLPHIRKTLRDLPELSELERESGIVVSAGPSLKRQESLDKIRAADYKGKIICTDGSYVALLKKGLVADYVISLDPHPTRIVRWFGDPDIERHMENDDYFERQDLNIDFRNNTIKENQANIELVNKFASKTKAIVATTVHKTITNRLTDAGFDIYWWHPLVDNPQDKDGLTHQLYSLKKLPCMNTGGTVGTTCLLFAELFLKLKKIAMVGMDYGYYNDLPIEKTQTYYELLDRVGKDNIKKCFIEQTFSLTGEKFFTDPTYYWYRRNLYDLLEKLNAKYYNCTEGGTVNHPKIQNVYLNEFLNNISKNV